LSLPFYIVDVFGERRYTGNQLAVFTRAQSLSDDEMQSIAKEMNYSETTFVLSDKQREGGYDVRIFTPKEEVPFAGHPTLGTAFVVMREIIGEPVSELVLNLKVGRIPVTAAYLGKEIDLLWMKQKEPTFGSTVSAQSVAAVLGLQQADIIDGDEGFPIEEVSTGMSFLIVPLRSRDAVKRCRVSMEKYESLTSGIPSKGIFVFCREPYDNQKNDLNARMFAPYYGVTEDPATGSANGCLAAYLVKHRYFGKPEVDVRVESGSEIGRASVFYLRSKEREQSIDVRVGGRVIPIAKGELV